MRKRRKKGLTTDEAARLAGETATWLQVMRHKGIGPNYFKDGAYVYYKRDDVLAWAAARDMARASHARP